ncbi:MAG TPA: hypothetical protein VG204_08795 [Terriglobia bacterium]|nr:hypothetical protein [Terriglobia bacterium]
MRPPQHPLHPHPERMFYVVFTTLFGLGAYLFAKGFRVYWKFRVIENLPLSPLRAVAMGLVRVRGRAAGDEVLTSPVTQQPCYYYKLMIDKWETDARNRSYWMLYRRDSDAVQFYLEDETGRATVYPRGAELDLMRTAQTIFVGQLPETLMFSSMRRTESMDTGNAPVAEAPGAAAAREEAVEELARSMAMIGAAPPPAGRFRLRESCILPGVAYEVTGTCVQNPLAKDPGDRNLIKKGINDPTFMISDKPSQQVEQRLDLRAIAYIFGGAFLMVLSVGLALLMYATT